MEGPVITHLPPAELCAVPLESEPRRHICLMVHIGDNDFVSLSERLPDRQADNTNERCRIHAEGDFVRTSGIHECSHTQSRSCDRRIDFLAFGVTASALNIAFEQMPVNCIEYLLGD